MTTFFKYFIPWLVKKIGSKGIGNVKKCHNMLTDGLLEYPVQTTVIYITLATVGFMLILLGLMGTENRYLITLPLGDRMATVDLYLPYIKVVVAYYAFAVICAAYKAFEREQGHMVDILKGKE